MLASGSGRSSAVKRILVHFGHNFTHFNDKKLSYCLAVDVQ